jgi:hypothetical protein
MSSLKIRRVERTFFRESLSTRLRELFLGRVSQLLGCLLVVPWRSLDGILVVSWWSLDGPLGGPN